INTSGLAWGARGRASRLVRLEVLDCMRRTAARTDGPQGSGKPRPPPEGIKELGNGPSFLEGVGSRPASPRPPGVSPRNRCASAPRQLAARHAVQELDQQQALAFAEHAGGVMLHRRGDLARALL